MNMNENSIIKYIICMIIHLRKHQVLNYLIWKELILNCIIQKKVVKLQRILHYIKKKFVINKIHYIEAHLIYAVSHTFFILCYKLFN